MADEATLEVVLVGAKGLENTDFMNNMDPYVILIYGSQKQKSSIASGQGTEPEWNETFTFNVTPNGSDQLTLKILDSDAGTCTENDPVGEAIVQLEPVFHEGSVPITSYNVVKDQEFRGEIKLSLSLNRKAHYYGNRTIASHEESYGGWRESPSD